MDTCSIAFKSHTGTACSTWADRSDTAAVDLLPVVGQWPYDLHPPDGIDTTGALAFTIVYSHDTAAQFMVIAPVDWQTSENRLPKLVISEQVGLSARGSRIREGRHGRDAADKVAFLIHPPNSIQSIKFSTTGTTEHMVIREIAPPAYARILVIISSTFRKIPETPTAS